VEAVRAKPVENKARREMSAMEILLSWSAGETPAKPAALFWDSTGKYKSRLAFE
jgi:hypothetical protein